MDIAVPLDDELFRSQTASRLPTYRQVDLLPGVEMAGQQQQPGHNTELNSLVSHKDHDSNTSTQSRAKTLQHTPKHTHSRTHSTSTIATSNTKRQHLPQPKTFTCTGEFAASESCSSFDAHPGITNIPSRAPKTRKIPASNSRNDLGEQYYNGPPPAMITQRSFLLENSSTTQDWVASVAQQSPTTIEQPPPSPSTQQQPLSSRSWTDNTQSRSVIKPIRGFKPSSRKSMEMASKRTSIDPDSTLRALEGFDSHRTSNQPEQEEHNSDDSDLFLRAAREEEIANQANNPHENGLMRSDQRRSRIGQRSSLPPSSSSFPSVSRRRGSDHESSTVSRPMDEQDGIGQALTYRPAARERPSALDEINRSRYYGANSRSNPTTPRAFGRREISPESQVSYSSGRRPSIPDHTMSARTSSYRQSNLSFSTPRTNNSSPLVSRTTDIHMHETPEIPRAVEDTESTVSTTAPSTVWDELDELKSRIHRLELTGKLPPTSGAAISRASNDRPPTATTTITTMSASPKRGRNNSISPIDSVTLEAPGEIHPLLHSALEKSRPLLSPEIYKALETAASDALAIASMMGSSGQPGPISSSQSTVGGASLATDRQVRRKADSMCRGLTELCLALSEGRNEHAPPVPSQISTRPLSRGSEIRQFIDPSSNQRQAISTELARVKSSPRALSRLEERRSSLLSGSSLPSPRYTPSESGTPTQSTMAGRRTSLLLRSRRAGTEDLEDDDEIRFRAPSRAATDLGRVRNSPREYVSQQPLPDRTPVIQSSLPVRRHYTSTSLNSVVPSTPPVSSLGGRRYLDRSTPERDTANIVTRLAEERAQRKSSIGQGFPNRTSSTTTRKTRQSNSMDLSAAGQNGGYQ